MFVDWVAVALQLLFRCVTFHCFHNILNTEYDYCPTRLSPKTRPGFIWVENNQETQKSQF